MMEGTKKRKIENYSTIEQKIRELEDRIEKLEKKKPAAARKSTVADLDKKMNTVLDILGKVVVPTTALNSQFISS